MKIAELFFWVFIGVILGASVALSETPNWALYDQRIAPKAQEYKDRWTFGDFDKQLGNYYYDAGLGFEWLSRELNQPQLLQSAIQGANVYAVQYALASGGNVPGYWNFTSGLTRLYQLTGTQAYKDAVLSIAEHGAYCRDSTSESTTSSTFAREVAYCISAMLDAEKLGAPRRERLFTLVANAQSHQEQWANQTAPFLNPFMFGLSAMSLIRYNDEVDNSLGIRERIQAAATFVKNTMWDEQARAFRYADRVISDPQNDLNPAPDLNLLIAPVYAWLGDREFAGKVFNGGVEGSYLGNFDAFKQFNQQNFFTERFETYMSATPTPTPTPTPSPTATPIPTPTPCAKSAKGNLTLKYLDCRVSRIVKMNSLEE